MVELCKCGMVLLRESKTMLIMGQIGLRHLGTELSLPFALPQLSWLT